MCRLPLAFLSTISLLSLRSDFDNPFFSRSIAMRWQMGPYLGFVDLESPGFPTRKKSPPSKVQALLLIGGKISCMSTVVVRVRGSRNDFLPTIQSFYRMHPFVLDIVEDSTVLAKWPPRWDCNFHKHFPILAVDTRQQSVGPILLVV